MNATCIARLRRSEGYVNSRCMSGVIAPPLLPPETAVPSRVPGTMPCRGLSRRQGSVIVVTAVKQVLWSWDHAVGTMRLPERRDRKGSAQMPTLEDTVEFQALTLNDLLEA